MIIKLNMDHVVFIEIIYKMATLSADIECVKKTRISRSPKYS